MKIVVISSYPTIGCGVSKYTGQLTGELKDNQIEIFSYRIFFYQEKLKNIFWLKIFYKVLKIKPDIIHIQYTPTICGPIMPAFLFLLRVISFKAKIILTAHEKPAVYLRHFNRIMGQLFLLYEKFIYSHSDRILVHTLEHKQELIDKYHLRDEGIEVIPHGIDKSQRVTPTQLQEIQDKYCLRDKQVITFFGIIRPTKGIEYLILSFSGAIKKEKDIVLLIAGSAPTVWTEYFQRLKDLVNNLGIEDSVRFTGFVEEEDIPAVLSISKIMVMPYTEITQSGVLYREVIPYTKPVIVTDIGDLGKAVERHNIGLVVPPNDVEPLTEAILDLIKAGPKLKAYQDNETKVKQKFSWHNVSKLHIQIFRDTLGQHEVE